MMNNNNNNNVLRPSRSVALVPAALLAAGALALFAFAGPARAADVDIAFDPVSVEVIEGDIVRIHLVVNSAGASAQPWDALDAILEWDPTYLDLIGSDQDDAEATFFLTGFLPDPDGINLNQSDGEVIFTALASPGNPVEAPPLPETLIVTTFSFEAVTPTPIGEPTIISFDRASGVFGETRVLLNGGNITGDISGTSEVEVLCDSGCPDFDNDGAVDFDDFTLLLATYGDCPKAMPCPADTDCDGDVDFDDFTFLLANYGECP